MNSMCEYCKYEVNLVDYNNKKICGLCNIIYNNKKEHVNMCLLGYSTLSQNEIVKKTQEYYIKNNKIPFPQIVDSDVKLVNIPVYLYSQFNNKQNNFEIFFTDNVGCLIDNSLDRMLKSNRKKEPIIKYYELENYIFSNEEQEKINNELENVRKKNFGVLFEDEQKFKLKCGEE